MMLLSCARPNAKKIILQRLLTTAGFMLRITLKLIALVSTSSIMIQSVTSLFGLLKLMKARLSLTYIWTLFTKVTVNRVLNSLLLTGMLPNLKRTSTLISNTGLDNKILALSLVVTTSSELKLVRLKLSDTQNCKVLKQLRAMSDLNSFLTIAFALSAIGHAFLTPTTNKLLSTLLSLTNSMFLTSMLSSMASPTTQRSAMKSQSTSKPRTLTMKTLSGLTLTVWPCRREFSTTDQLGGFPPSKT